MAEEISPSNSPDAAASAAAAASLGHSVIPIVNKLQDIFAQLGSQSTIELPQVAVVGSQSSGKSSVLEALVGRDFLPRGSDICTRRPLVLQLLQTKRNPDGTDEEWGEFLHLPGKRFFDFNEIRWEIQAETEREAGGNKGVSDKQIRLKIFSPNVLDITLVDLPGITKVPVGDQPSDIEARIRTMIMSYIKLPSCLILAVTPANSDLANSDALQIAGNADPDGYRTIGVITKLDIMDRGTDARNFLLGKVIPLRLGYVGIVNRNQELNYAKQDIMMNRSIKDALVAEEKFFRSRPVYSDLADRCGVPQLAKKLNQVIYAGQTSVIRDLPSSLFLLENKHHNLDALSDKFYGHVLMIGYRPPSAQSHCPIPKEMQIFQILVQHIKKLLPGLKSRVSAGLVSVAKEHASYGEITESKAGMGALLLNILSKYSEAFSSMIEGKNEEMSTSELSGGARIHYIFQNIFVMSLEEVDPCEDLTDDDIRTAIQNATGAKSALFVPEMDYINTSHPNFIGGTKAHEMALQQVKSSRIAAPNPRQKDGVDLEKAPTSERSLKSRAILARSVGGFVPDQVVRPAPEVEKTTASGSNVGSSWGISSIFGGSDNRASVKDNFINKPFSDTALSMDHAFSMIHLREPPSVLRPSETHSEQETIEIAITKLLLRSYYDIVRKNIEDSVPKAIMHFLGNSGTVWSSANSSVANFYLGKVNHTKRDLHNVFIKKLYRENLLEEMLQEPDEIAMKRKRTRETLRVLQQAFKTLEELPLDAETVERGYSLGTDPTGLPKIHGLPTSSMYTTSSGSTDSYTGSPKNSRLCNASHSGELQLPMYGGADSNGSGHNVGIYPTVGV
ncbi:hypothetical protein RDI58_003295 [Solanum bulbocastanum]|uniref:Uncharacterized protein n=1 Tax=Solanum bulbocastanum TaxID=147425 RepID=A0AAN8UG31_SOLBU